MMHFIKPEYLVSLYLNLYDKEEVTLKDLGDYAGKLNRELRENNIEAVFLFSDKYIEEMLFYNKDYFEYNGTFEDVVTQSCTPWIKRTVPNDILSLTFTSWLSHDVLNVISNLKLKEKKMTTEEKIDVMKAYTEGKTIQVYVFNDKTWEDVSYEPVWDWDNYLYRVKPEPTYRPYKDIEEMLEDIKKRLVAIQHPVFSGIWLKLKDKDGEEMIVGIDHANSEILLGKDWNSLKIVFEHFTYLDGTPFGIKE